MICKTLGQMNGVAKNGAAKMLNEEFSFSEVKGEAGMYKVVTAKGTAYKVDPTIGGRFLAHILAVRSRRIGRVSSCAFPIAHRSTYRNGGI